MHPLRETPWAANLRRRNITVVVASVITVAAMVALSFAAVPLYRLFCQVTGVAGTTQVAASAPGAVGSKVIAVRFDANVAPGRAWRFVAPEPVEVRLGEERLVAFTATNVGYEPLLGTATFNVTPLQIGKILQQYRMFLLHRAAAEAWGEQGVSGSFFITSISLLGALLLFGGRRWPEERYIAVATPAVPRGCRIHDLQRMAQHRSPQQLGLFQSDADVARARDRTLAAPAMAGHPDWRVLVGAPPSSSSN